MIDKMLSISTAHLTPETAKNWNEGKLPEIWIMAYQYGWVMWVDEDPDAVPAEVSKIFEVAHLAGCKFVRLDCDVEPHPELPTYEW